MLHSFEEDPTGFVYSLINVLDEYGATDKERSLRYVPQPLVGVIDDCRTSVVPFTPTLTHHYSPMRYLFEALQFVKEYFKYTILLSRKAKDYSPAHNVLTEIPSEACLVGVRVLPINKKTTIDMTLICRNNYAPVIVAQLIGVLLIQRLVAKHYKAQLGHTYFMINTLLMESSSFEAAFDRLEIRQKPPGPDTSHTFDLLDGVENWEQFLDELLLWEDRTNPMGLKSVFLRKVYGPMAQINMMVANEAPFEDVITRADDIRATDWQSWVKLWAQGEIEAERDMDKLRAC